MPTMIREDAWPRIRALAAKMGWDIRTAIGCVVSLWDDSQKVGVHTATAQEIAFWCHEHDHGKQPMLLQALEDNAVRFVSRVNETHFSIRGNEDEILRIRRAQKKGRQNAKSRWNKEKADATCIGASNARPIASGMPELNQAKPSQAELNQARKKTPPPSAFDLRLAQDWAAHASSKAPHLRPDPTKYADAIRKLREKVGLTEAQVEETLAWIRQSDFWAANALSPASLLNVGKSGVRKIDTIRAQMLERPEEGREMTQADWDRVFAGGQQP